jgi:choline dehydrogenase-like flavoprotein
VTTQNGARHKHSLEFDAIVVGSGAGGCAAAYSLVQSGLRVALVEKGRELPRDSSTLDIDTVVHDGHFKSNETWLDGRGQRFAPEEYFNVGGKTKWYGAALLRYSAAEFAAETAHQCRSWPIAYDDLAPYYDEASRLLGVRTFDCEPNLARIAARMRVRSPRWRSEPMPLGLSAQILQNSREASHFDGFASVAGLKADAESSFLRLVRAAPELAMFEGMPVSDLVPNPDRVQQIQGVRLADGRVLRARSVLLAAGALHSPRLLQRFVERNRLQGAMPSHDEIGRNLKLHLLTAMVAVSPSVKSDLIRKTSLFLHDQLPHSSVQPLGFDGELIATLIPRWVPRFAANMVGRRAYGFFLQTEDGSHRDNRVIAAGAADGSGKEYPTMDYDAGRLRPAFEEHRDLIRRFRAALLGIGMISFSQRIGLAGTAHVSGTLIAGDDPRTSVVDAHGKVHGLESLYVVDASILPRSSRVNPSLTIYAWSLRTAALLARQLADRDRHTSPIQLSAWSR